MYEMQTHPVTGLLRSGKVPYFRDLVAAQVLASMMGAEMRMRPAEKINVESMAKMAMRAADALESALEESTKEEMLP